MNAVAEYGHWEPRKLRRLPQHKNPGLEIVYIAKGHLLWSIEGRKEAVGPGSVFFSLPWQLHGGVSEVEPGSDLYYVVVRLEAEYARPRKRFKLHPDIPWQPAVSRSVAKVLSRVERHTYRASPAVAFLLPAIVREKSRPGTGHEDWLRGAVGTLVLELVRCVEDHEQANRESSPSVQRVSAFLHSLNKRSSEPWTLEAMADACGLGRTRFAEIVAEETGDSPITILNRLRVRTAKQLLTGTALPITTIAFDCGFQSSQYFAKVFREFTGQNARFYRKTGGAPQAGWA